MLAAEDKRHDSAPEIVKILLDFGMPNNVIVDVNLKNADEYTALNLAAQVGSTESVRAMLNRKDQTSLDLELDNKFGKTPFLLAAEFNHLEILRLLHQNGANVNHASKLKKTPLMMAAVKGKAQHDVLNYLLAIPEIKLNGALQMACEARDIDEVAIVSLLSKHPVEEEILEAQAKACSKGYPRIVNILNGYTHDRQWAYRDKANGSSMLMLACNEGKVDIVMLLVDKIVELHRGVSHRIGGLFVSEHFTSTNKVHYLSNFYMSACTYDNFVSTARMSCHTFDTSLLWAHPLISPSCNVTEWFQCTAIAVRVLQEL